MDRNAFSIVDGNKNYLIQYMPRPARWAEYFVGEDNPIRLEENWSEEIKYIENNQRSPKIDNLPTDTGGVYIFYLKGINLPFMEKYILYIGRAQYTKKMNIRVRAKSYFSDNRITIQEMFHWWGNDLYYRYYPDKDNDKIKSNEAALIRAIFPPYNSIIPDKFIVEPKVSAF